MTRWPFKPVKDGHRTLSFERRLFLMALLVSAPGVLTVCFIMWNGAYSSELKWTVTTIVPTASILLAAALETRVLRPLQTIANLLAALREGDFSIRGSEIHQNDTVCELMLEINALRTTLQEQRFGEREADTLLRTVMEVIDIAILTFDDEQKLRQINRAGEQLLGGRGPQLLGRSANELGLAECLHGEKVRTMEKVFRGGIGRWRIRRNVFRQAGRRHQLLVLSDLSRTLRDEERKAWQRLLRVIGHELNNSMAAIKSIAVSLHTLLGRELTHFDCREDLRNGLRIISARAESLTRFTEAYSRLARLPPPRAGKVQIESWVGRVAELETRTRVILHPGPKITITADPDQLEQLLINLICNAVDASLETGGVVEVTWREAEGYVELLVQDEGLGLPDTPNLFVPFFTTKPNGTGIGLVLSRQIADAHGGTLSLENRLSKRGCVAKVRLPIA